MLTLKAADRMRYSSSAFSRDVVRHVEAAGTHNSMIGFDLCTL